MKNYSIRFEIGVFFLLAQFVVTAQNTYSSVLSEGELLKIEVIETGVYKLTFEELSEQLADLSAIDPNTIQFFGNGGGMLPESNSVDRIDDLAELSIKVVGAEDGRFDAGDYVLFYGEGADKVVFDSTNDFFSLQKNVYANANYYFLRVGVAQGKRIETEETTAVSTYITNEFDDYIHFEEDKVNLLDAFLQAQGSGKRWYGDLFKNIKTITYDFEFPNLLTAYPVKVRSRFAGRSKTNETFTISTDNTTLSSNVISNAGRSFNNPTESTYAFIGNINGTITANADQLELAVTYNGTEGWLDYISLNARRQLRYNSGQLIFRDLATLDHEKVSYQINSNSTNAQVWNITDHAGVIEKNISRSNGQLEFTSVATDLERFIVFESSDLLIPTAMQAIPNQNLHGIEDSELVIVFHEAFRTEAARLMEHRQNHTNLIVDTIEIQALYNEFSSGRQDPTAIRDFAKMLYERNPSFKYLLLFGDGSFDYRDIGKRGGNFIPVYETFESENPINAFPSDDYFGLLDDDEGTPSLRGELDISIGRLTVKTPEEAAQVVDKILNYDLGEECLGEWRNRLVFVADDEDNNLHIRDADLIADGVAEAKPIFNQEKIYFDAFPQESTSGGEAFPQATEAISQSMFKGAIAINYLGHGGSQGWAQERVLDKNRGDIRSWNNRNRLPVFVTATCSFSGYDDPNQVTGGEEVLLNPNGGGIALLTTVRAVYASSNATLVEDVFDIMFDKIDGRRPTLGEIIKNAKNSSSTGRSVNSRKFTLLGDPSQPLAIPFYDVVTTRINKLTVNSESLDTLRALQQIEIEGEIQDEAGQRVSTFNGELIPTIFDKRITYTTLAQDPSSNPFDFDLQENVIFKGRVSVENGRFRYTFVVPKDINYEIGAGKISYYALDRSMGLDATGAYEQIMIGGRSEAVFADDVGPDVQLFINDEQFKFGGITNENPTLIVRLEDDNGINVAGNSIGHDLEAVLDDDTKNTFLLNDFYESDLNDYTKGVVRFPLQNLAEGRHQIKVKAWDVANNSAEGYTEFVVVNSAAAAIQSLLVYPNPFSEETCFLFQHNLNGFDYEAEVQIFDTRGALVKVIQQNFKVAEAAESACMYWNGNDTSNAPLPKGIYFFRVKLQAADKKVLSDVGKLVIIR